MSVHQKPDGRWFVVYYLPGERTRAKRKYFGRGKQARLAADAWDVEYRRTKQVDPALAAQVLAQDREITFLELAQRYLDQRDLSPRTRDTIVRVINGHVADLWGQMPVSKLTMRHLADLDAILIKTGRSVATRNRHQAYCRAVCSWGVLNDLIETNPFAKFHPNRKKEGKAPDLITDDELRAIWNAAPDHLRWAIECMLNLGVRPGRSELFAIKMTDVDLPAGGIWIARTKTHTRRTLLPVTSAFLTALTSLIKAEPGREYLIEYQGRPVRSLKTAWWATLRRAGITRRLRLYDLRHKYASLLLAQPGQDIKAVSELMGHSSPSLTLSTYYHLLERQKRQAVERLEVPRLARVDQNVDQAKKEGSGRLT